MSVGAPARARGVVGAAEIVGKAKVWKKSYKVVARREKKRRSRSSETERRAKVH